MCYSTLKSAVPLQRPDRDPRELGSEPMDPHVRASDAERDTTVAMLSDAAAEGYLTPDELDERLSATLAARTIEDLTRLTRDLPPEWRIERGRQAAQREAKDAVRPQIATYLGVMALLVMIWLIAGLTAGAWYPWPIWPALGWGIALVVRARVAARPVEL